MATKSKEPTIKMTPQAMQIKNKRAMDQVRATKSKAEEQLEREWERYQEAKRTGNAKAAIEAFKMWNFINKMCQLANRFVVALERVQSIQSLFDMLQSTSALFGQIMSLDNTGVMKDMKKNLKTFKRKLKEYEHNMTEVFDLLDDLFDDKPNIFVRFFNWITRKKDKTDAEKLAEMEAASGAEMRAYQTAHGETVDEKKDEGGAGTPGTPGAPSGGGDLDLTDIGI